MSKRNNTGGKGSSAPGSAERRLRVVESGEVDPNENAINDHEGDYNLRILQPIFGYVREKFGDETLADIIHDCGLPENTIDRQSGWISHECLEHLLASARELVDSDEEFMRAAAYDMKKHYGAFILIIRAMSVQSIYQFMVRTGHMVSSVGKFSIELGTRNSARVIYTTTRPESRLNCLARQRQFSAMPSLFVGIPPAKLVEHACVAHGDDRCEYELSWYEPLRLRLLGGGLLAGALIALGLPADVVHPMFSFTTLPLLGAAAGGLLELRRLIIEQARFTSDTLREMEKVVEEHSQATDELTMLRERESDWNRLVEDGVAMRTRKLNAVVERLKAIIRQRSGEFPVVQKSTSSSSSQSSPFLPAESDRSPVTRLESMENAVDRVSQLVGELVSIASDDNTKRSLEAEEISVDNMVAMIRRQLKATMIGRNVRITVFQTREAPATIVSFKQILDRVIDNVLLNASRHTDRGSVVVEASGTPGSLLIKLSDTGMGIPKERLEQVFDDNHDRPDGSPTPNDRSGLAYAARLLDHIGGRLEIMSEPGVGTTLWLYIPINPPGENKSSDGDREEDAPRQEESIVGRVVRIRSNLNPAAMTKPEEP
ncbi:MAG: hypothetical protein KDK70_06675 [Myxococcales bacterium]|nr:hypothetical protein [Myxococcales bacterium]